MYAAGAYGPQVFHSIFSIDRPLRAFLMIPAYMLFGGDPIWYGLSAYIFRCLGALALWWQLKMLWPKGGSAAFVAALLFAVILDFYLSLTRLITTRISLHISGHALTGANCALLGGSQPV
jgi:hypothetical protein